MNLQIRDKDRHIKRLKDDLNLANEDVELKKSEIEKHKERCSKCGNKTTKTILNMQEIFAEQCLEIERLKVEIDRLKSMNQSKLDMIHDLQTSTEEIKPKIENKTIKEFAKGLDKTLLIYYKDDQCISVGQFRNIIKIVAKQEMAGNDNDR